MRERVKHFYLESEGNGGLVTGVRECNLKAKKIKFDHRKFLKRGIKMIKLEKNSSCY